MKKEQMNKDIKMSDNINNYMKNNLFFLNKEFKFYVEEGSEQFRKIEYRPVEAHQEYKETLNLFLTNTTPDFFKLNTLKEVIAKSIEDIEDKLFTEQVFFIKIESEDKKEEMYITSYIVESKTYIEIITQFWFMLEDKITYIQFAKIIRKKKFNGNFLDKNHGAVDVEKMITYLNEFRLDIVKEFNNGNTKQKS
jgi:predicted DNA-binding protein